MYMYMYCTLVHVLYTCLSFRSAVHWWKEGLSKAVQEPLPPPPSSRGREGVGLLGRCGLWGCVLGGVLATKLARYGCHKRLAERLHYTLLAADLFKVQCRHLYTVRIILYIIRFCNVHAHVPYMQLHLQAVLCYSLPHPSSELSYVSYQLARRAGTELAPGVELFSGARHRGCHPGTVLDALQWASRQLVARGYAAKVGLASYKPNWLKMFSYAEKILCIILYVDVASFLCTPPPCRPSLCCGCTSTWHTQSVGTCATLHWPRSPGWRR